MSLTTQIFTKIRIFVLMLRLDGDMMQPYNLFVVNQRSNQKNFDLIGTFMISLLPKGIYHLSGVIILQFMRGSRKITQRGPTLMFSFFCFFFYEEKEDPK